MAILIQDPDLEADVRATLDRAEECRWTEVWEGVTVVPPMPNDEHQDLVMSLGSCLYVLVQDAGVGDVRPGVNVSDRAEGWKSNYRVPDLAVYLNGSKARNCGTHWCGGPDVCVEIVSEGEDIAGKLAFYGAVGTRELWVIDRAPWRVVLWSLGSGGELLRVGEVSADSSEKLTSGVLPLRVGMESASPRPRVVVEHLPSGKTWRV